MKTRFMHLILIIVAGTLISCGTTGQFSPGKGNKYHYSYSLAYPVENASLFFQDDSIIAQFKFDEAAIRFQLQNISESYLTVQWEKASINIQGRCFNVRHASNLYTDTLRDRSIVLPPLGYVRDLAIPSENIYYDGNRWVEVDLLPTEDGKSSELQESIRNNIGRRIGLVLPVMFGSTEKNYEFQFKVDSVNRIPWREYEPVQRIPEPPNPKRGVLGLDNVTTAIIAVGILGFSAYVLSVKKNPPSE